MVEHMGKSDGKKGKMVKTMGKVMEKMGKW
jgi:hypothetical protein